MCPPLITPFWSSGFSLSSITIGFETMKKAWDDYGYEMILQINKLVDERESMTEVGKDSFCWANMASHWFAWLGKNNL